MTASVELSVVVPCFNEEANVPETTERVLRVLELAGITSEIVLVDDASRDRTREVIEEQKVLYGERVIGCFHEQNRGLAAGWQTGVTAAHGAYVAVIDADLQYQPEDIVRLYTALLESSVDIVQGFRSTVGRARGTRYVLSRGLNTILNQTFGMQLRDNKSGFLCCAREVMLDILVHRGRYAYWQSFIMVAAHARGYSYREIETLFLDRKQGKSFLEGQAVRAAIKNFADVGTAFWEYRVKPQPRPLSRVPAHAADPPAHPLRLKAYLATARVGFARGQSFERTYENLCATQWLPAAELRALQDQKLRRLVRHAYRNVPYYRARMRGRGLTPDDIRTQDDLHKLPLLSKDDVRKHLYFDIIQEGVSPADLQRISTAGNSGEPLTCFAESAQLEFRKAAELRFREWTGYRFGDPWVFLTHDAEVVARARSLRSRVDASLSGLEVIGLGGVTEATLDRVADQIREKRPTLIEGDAEVLELLAERVGELNGPWKGVVSSGQTLGTKARAAIEQAFGCPVFDVYGSSEFSRVAHEAEAREGHLVAGEGYIVEVLMEGRTVAPGEIGEVVITDLTGYAMPLVRYRIGDLAEAAPEPTAAEPARGLPRLGQIHGRVQSILRGPDGRFIPGSVLHRIAGDFDFAIAKLSAVQTEPGAITLHIVKARRYADETLAEIEERLKGYLGPELAIEIAFEEPASDSPLSSRPTSQAPPVDLQRPQGLKVAR